MKPTKKTKNCTNFTTEIIYSKRSSKTILSICIPTFNRDHYLLKNLTSLVTEMTSEVEIIIADNNSSDNTRESIVAFIQKNTALNLTFLSHSQNIGFDLNLLSAVDAANGKFCWFLGDDDLIDKNGVKRILDFLESNKTMDFILLNLLFQEKNGDVFLISSLPNLSFVKLLDFFFYPCQKSYLKFLGLNIITMSICVVNRNSYLVSANTAAMTYAGSHFLHFVSIIEMLKDDLKEIAFISEPVIIGRKSDRAGDWGGKLFWLDFIDEVCAIFTTYGLAKKNINRLRYSSVNGLTLRQKIYHGLDRVYFLRELKRYVLEIQKSIGTSLS
ncbi:glycosyltransferase family 2 protein [Synechococcus moorigangaii CMS01]|nr:glycosyltransferase family 2 protein [Synechococcus moorigangaii CMS01]